MKACKKGIMSRGCDRKLPWKLPLPRNRFR
jgi:hypothetical protein